MRHCYHLCILLLLITKFTTKAQDKIIFVSGQKIETTIEKVTQDSVFLKSSQYVNSRITYSRAEVDGVFVEDETKLKYKNQIDLDKDIPTTQLIINPELPSRINYIGDRVVDRRSYRNLMNRDPYAKYHLILSDGKKRKGISIFAVGATISLVGFITSSNNIDNFLRANVIGATVMAIGAVQVYRANSIYEIAKQSFDSRILLVDLSFTNNGLGIVARF